MEIKDILKELIVAANASLNHSGAPENFDLEEMIETLEGYYEELDYIGEFTYYEDEINDDFFDDDDDWN